MIYQQGTPAKEIDMNVQTATINLAAAYVAKGYTVEQATEIVITKMIGERPELALKLLRSIA